jgi:regulator of sigma E protease
MFDFLLGNDALSAIIAFILVLIPAVLVHELGHFLAAKGVGITILEFGIGFPPRAMKLFRYKGTDYTLNWLPLGGFVRPLGEDIVRQTGSENTTTDRDEAIARGITNPKTVNEVSPIARMIFLSMGAVANFVMAFLLFMLIALIGLPQITGGRASIVHVETNSVLAAAGLQSGDMIEAINGEPLPTAAAFIEALQIAQQPVELTVRRFPSQEILTLAVPAPVNAAPSDTAVVPHPLIRGIAPDSPAEAAGLRQGDMVIAFNGEPIDSYETLQAATQAHLEQPVTLTIWREGGIVEVILVPRANPPQGQGAMGISIGNAALAPALGLAFAEGIPQQTLVPQSLPVAARYAVERIVDVFRTIFSIPGEIIRGTAAPESLRLTGPLGISQAGGVFLQESIQQERPSIMLEFMALISLALGFTNLLPIPALDGGRIVFVLIELVRGRPIAPEREGMVHLVGLALLLSLMVVVVLNDIANPLTDLLR